MKSLFCEKWLKWKFNLNIIFLLNFSFFPWMKIEEQKKLRNERRISYVGKKNSVFICEEIWNRLDIGGENVSLWGDFV